MVQWTYDLITNSEMISYDGFILRILFLRSYSLDFPTSYATGRFGKNSGIKSTACFNLHEIILNA